VSGTDPNPGFSRRDDKTQPFRPGGPTDPPPPPPDAPKIPGITIHYEIARGGMVSSTPAARTSSTGASP
jgi:hypothetical protein